MVGYIAKRVLAVIPTVFIVVFLVFVLTRVAGDPAAMYIEPGTSPEQAARIRQVHHLDEPLLTQFVYYLRDLSHGNLGFSRISGIPVLQAIGKYFPATLELTLISMLVAVVLGVRLGVSAAARAGGALDQVSRVAALGGVSVPIFWLALILLYIFYARFRVLPVGRANASIWPLSDRHTNIYILDALINGNLRQLGDAIMHLLLPVFCLSYLQLAIIMRVMRSSMLEVLREDYIATARAKGVSERHVIRKHARRNALLPTVTIVGFSFGTMLSGSILTEKVFNWPGMGSWAVRSILNLDTASILGYVLITGLVYALVNLMTDVLYSYLDPRIVVR